MSRRGRFLITALYKFVAIDDPAALIEVLRRDAEAADLCGSLLVAPEGINGTIAGSEAALRAFLERLRADPRFADLSWKEAWAEARPFGRMKVRLKREIVSMGAPGLLATADVGTYVAPRDWNALISDPDVAVIDTRNDYEVAIGRFNGAIDPQTSSFRDFPAWVDAHRDALANTRKIAMYCTGGIRCEKATAYLKSVGFENVYHLDGGILRYLEDVPAEESLWRGECFVFDDRVSVDHSLEKGHYDLCHGCRRPITEEDRRSPQFTPGVACPACADTITAEQRRGREERSRQMRLAAARGDRHLGAKAAKSA